jgi:sucrose-6F-phosphate phosphohydrolase
VSPILFVTDLDHTLVGDDFAHEQLNEWLLAARSNGSKIVYSTGRSLMRYQQLATEAPLFEPDLLIASVGTAMYSRLDGAPNVEWQEKLKAGWDRDAVMATIAHFSDLVLQPETEQSAFKASFFLTEEASIELLPQLETLFKQQDLEVQMIYSSGRDLDLLPRHANKGSALTFVRQTLGFEPEQTIVCGDSGNDIALFAAGSERGIIVGNAQPELRSWHRDHPSENRYFAKSFCAAGILEGLEYFGFR